MSQAYFITPVETAPNFQVDVDLFKENLKRDWSITEIWETDQSNNLTYLFHWELDLYGRAMWGLQSDHQTITTQSANYGAIADFSLWYQKLVPAEIRLCVFTAVYWEKRIELLSETTREDIIEALNKAWIT